MPDKKPGRGPKQKQHKKGSRRVPQAAKTASRPRKIPRVEAAVDVYGLRPSWSFAYLDIWWGATPEDGCGWIHLSPDDHQELLDRFRAWELMTWGEILNAPGRPNHPIPVENLFPKAQKRLQRLKYDVDEVLSLRVNSTARVFGVLSLGTFKILWWDPDHCICPSELKNT